jgi:preprotein translocase SecE subunit
MDSFMNYLREAREELSHVSWPTTQQTIMYTIIVVIASVVVALFLGVFDFAFLRLMSLINGT